MQSLTDLRAAARDPRLDPALRAVLILRFEQLGGLGADFHVVQPGYDMAVVETAIGYPMTLDDAPCWEWLAHHPGGWTEVVFILSDDGHAQGLLVPDDADPAITALLREHANG